MSGIPELSIVIPCYNESETLLEVINEMIEQLEQANMPGGFQLILVDDASQDDSPKLIAELAEKNDSVTALFSSENGGMWRAIHQGFQSVTGRFVTFLPADGEVGISNALRLYGVSKDADMVLSDRRPLEGDQEIARQVRPWYRGVLSYGQRKLTAALIGLDLSGNEGIFLLRWDVFRDWATAERDDNVLFLEILWRGIDGASRNEVRIARSTTYYEVRRNGRSKMLRLGYILNTLRDIITLRNRVR